MTPRADTPSADMQTYVPGINKCEDLASSFTGRARSQVLGLSYSGPI